MQINLFSDVNHDNYKNTLIDQKGYPEILEIAVVIFFLLAACCAVSGRCFKIKPWNGHGKNILPNGTIHKGEFFEGKLIKGTKKFPNGLEESGSFKNGLLDGSNGKKVYPKKCVIEDKRVIEEGLFEAGWLKEGTRTELDGQIVKIFDGKPVQTNPTVEEKD